MIQRSVISIQLLLLVPFHLANVAMLLIGGVSAFILTLVLTFGVGAFAYKVGWLDYPEERRIHTKPVPRLGGVAIFLAFVVASFLFYTPGSTNEVIIYWLLISAGTLIVLVHAFDDVVGLKPLPKLIAQTIAVIIVMGPWDGLFHGILLFTFNNPFGHTVLNLHQPWYQQPVIYLFIHPATPATQPGITLLAIPAIALTWFWTVGMMNTVNWIDGMDGLATGVVGISGLFITLTSLLMGQQSIAVLAAIFTGATLGFLPHNWNPARIFMGDSGAMFLGLGLAVLSIMGGAKLASALIVLGVPILDVALVILNRIRRGQSPLHYDKTHLQYRLMATGLSVKQICSIFYGLTFAFGLLALSISGIQSGYEHFYKFIGIAIVGIAMVGLVIWIDYRQRQRGIPIRLGGPDSDNDGRGGSLQERTIDNSNQTAETAPDSEWGQRQNRPPSDVSGEREHTEYVRDTSHEEDIIPHLTRHPSSAL
jgi:UDP-GlcNAc:undecaprenyl-phosphate GlcNAc-1-phosphate transferase